MRRRVLGLLWVLSLSACTPWMVLGDPPDVPSPAVETSQALLPEPLAPVIVPPVAEVTYVSLPAMPPLPAPSKQAGKTRKPVPEVAPVPEPPVPLGPPDVARRKPLPEPTPQQVIQDAQRAARVAPTARGYFGGRGVHRFLWSPAKIYDVYLTPAHQTRLELPPGEVLGHALILNPRSFDVTVATVETAEMAHSLILIRPCAATEGEGENRCIPSPNVDVAITSASGRSYDVHLIVGTVGMVGATWEVVPISLIQGDDPGLLPRGSTPH